MEEELSLEIVTVGYEFRSGAPKVNIWNCDLRNKEVADHEHLQPSDKIQNSQNFTTDFPIIAY